MSEQIEPRLISFLSGSNIRFGVGLIFYKYQSNTEKSPNQTPTQIQDKMSYMKKK